MWIVDEWGEDETASRSIYMSGIRLGPTTLSTGRSQVEKMGGEVRVELSLSFSYEPTGAVKGYNAKLFEGTSEETGDLEDTKTGDFTVDKDKTVSRTIHLVNTDVAGGDIADITLQVTNQRQP